MSKSAKAAAKFSDEMLLMTARLYYVDGLPQADVARIMDVSQPQISRLLSLARERGIVRITVADYNPREPELEKALQRKLGLRNVIVIKTVHGSKAKDLRYTVAHFAANDIAQMINNVQTMAIAGGRMLQEVCEQLRGPDYRTNLTVVQIMGNVGSIPTPYDGLELGRMLAAKWRGSFLMLNSPALLPDSETRNAIMNIEDNMQVARRFSKCDLAIIGVGTLHNSVFIERNVFSEKDLKQVVKAGAVGEICGRYYNAEGRECDTPLKDRIVSITIDQLRRTPQVLGVTVGDDRSQAVLAAIRGDIIKSLVIDDVGAQALIDALPSRSSRVTKL